MSNFMITSSELIRWLKTMPPGSPVCINEGGLALLGPDGAYLEIGGEPLEDQT